MCSKKLRSQPAWSCTAVLWDSHSRHQAWVAPPVHCCKLLSPASNDVEVLRHVYVPAGLGSTVVAADVLWSDPVLEPGLKTNDSRGIGLIFGPDVTEVGGCVGGSTCCCLVFFLT
jgi:hypothetical protein